MQSHSGPRSRRCVPVASVERFYAFSVVVRPRRRSVAALRCRRCGRMSRGAGCISPSPKWDPNPNASGPEMGSANRIVGPQARRREALDDRGWF